MGLMDLLPEFETPVPKTSSFADVQKKHFGLKERACAQCGKRFVTSASATGYRRNVQGKELAFCSWTCLRRDERERPDVKAGRKKGSGRSIEQKRADMERRNAQDRAMLEGEQGSRLTPKERKRIQTRISQRTKDFERSAKNG